MVLCGTKNGSSMASLEEPFVAPLFLRVQTAAFTPREYWIELSIINIFFIIKKKV